MKRINWQALANVYFVLLMCVSPWFENVYRLPRLEIDHPILSQLSTSGLVNLIITGSGILVLAPLLVKEYSLRPPRLWDYIIFLWPVINVLHFRKLDIPGVVSLENALFIGILLLVLLRRKEIFSSFHWLKANGLYLYMASYSLSLFLPFLIPIEGYNLYVSTSNVDRYKGWSGTGSISFVGVAVALWGIIELLAQNSANKFKAGMALVAVALGIIGVHLAVLRIGWLAILCALVYATFAFLIRRNIALGIVFLCLSSLTFVGFFASKLRKKADFGYRVVPYISSFYKEVAHSVQRKEADSESKKAVSEVKSEAPSVDIKQQPKPLAPPPPPPSQPPVPNNPIQMESREAPPLPEQPVNPPVAETQRKPIKKIIIEHLEYWNGYTSGRVTMTFLLLSKFFEQPWIGLGTGGAGRYLRDTKFPALEAHNEYLRFALDHGIMGLIVLLAIIVCLTRQLYGQKILIVLFCLGVLMLTDNILLYPGFGYGPLFIVMFLGPVVKNSTSV